MPLCDHCLSLNSPLPACLDCQPPRPAPRPRCDGCGAEAWLSECVTPQGPLRYAGREEPAQFCRDCQPEVVPEAPLSLAERIAREAVLNLYRPWPVSSDTLDAIRFSSADLIQARNASEPPLMEVYSNPIVVEGEDAQLILEFLGRRGRSSETRVLPPTLWERLLGPDWI